MFSIPDIAGMIPAPFRLVLLGIGAITLARKLLGGLSLFSTFVLSGTNVRLPSPSLPYRRKGGTVMFQSNIYG